MSQKNETLPLVLALLVTLGVLGGGAWWLQSSGMLAGLLGGGSGGSPPPAKDATTPTTSGSGDTAASFPLPSNVAPGTTIRIDGSTSMAQINVALKNQFEQQFSGASVITQAQGSNTGLQRLAAGEIDLAATSRPVTQAEEGQGLRAVMVTADALAVIIGVNNPFSGTLSRDQVRDIFTGRITNWQEVGGPNATIRVLNRPPASGTHTAFQDIALQGQPFGTTPNITTMPRDETTGMIQQLGSDGIGYATYAQVATQSLARSLPIDGINPQAPNYPLQRLLFYAYQEPANEAVQAFLGFAASPLGKQIVDSNR